MVEYWCLLSKAADTSVMRRVFTGNSGMMGLFLNDICRKISQEAVVNDSELRLMDFA